MPLHTRKQLRSIFFGMFLGDSWISKQGHFGCEQITAELIELKCKLLEEYVGRKLTISYRERKNAVIEGRFVKAKPTYMIRVIDKSLKKFHRVLYNEAGAKRLTAGLLRRLSPEAIAMWLMDDGYLDYKKGNDTRYLMLCTDSFSPQEHQLIIDYFKTTWDIDCFIRPHQRNKLAKKNQRIAFNGKNAQKLVALIHKFVLPCFYYKIDLRYKRMDSVNIYPEYRDAINYITQNGTPLW